MKYVYTIMCLLLLTQAKSTIRYVSPNGIGTNNGLSWTTATPFQTAINNSAAGDEIWVRAGTYTPQSGFTFSMKPGVKIYGGFAGTETLLSQRNFRTNVVIFQGNNSSVFVNNNSLLNTTALLDGVTITGGRAPRGGGMYNQSASSPALSNVIFDDNQASLDGGALWLADGNPVLTNVIFRNNRAGVNGTGSGGAIYNDEGYPSLTNVAFENNSCNKDGGAVYNYVGILSRRPSFTNVLFFNNRAVGVQVGLL